jgi:hypothetical protein
MQLGNLFKKAKVVYDKRGGSAAARATCRAQGHPGRRRPDVDKLKRAAEALRSPARSLSAER